MTYLEKKKEIWDFVWVFNSTVGINVIWATKKRKMGEFQEDKPMSYFCQDAHF